MRISSGISEISIRGSYGKADTAGKIYLWPNYNAGNVEKIRGVVRRTESNIIYSKPLEDEVPKVFSNYHSLQKEYTSQGNMEKNRPSTMSGMLFEAIV